MSVLRFFGSRFYLLPNRNTFRKWPTPLFLPPPFHPLFTYHYGRLPPPYHLVAHCLYPHALFATLSRFAQVPVFDSPSPFNFFFTQGTFSSVLQLVYVALIVGLYVFRLRVVEGRFFGLLWVADVGLFFFWFFFFFLGCVGLGEWLDFWRSVFFRTMQLLGWEGQSFPFRS